MVSDLLPGIRAFAQQLDLGAPIEIFAHSDFDRGDRILTISCASHQRDVAFSRIIQLYEVSDWELLRALEAQILDIKYTIATYEF